MSNPEADNHSRSEEKVYLKIELDALVALQIEFLAAQQDVPPFGLCVALLREAIDKRNCL